MKRIIYLSLVMSLIGITVVSCSDEAPTQKPAVKSADEQAKPSPGAAAAAKIVPAAPIQPTTVVERPRNPFTPPVIKASVAKPGEKMIPKGPLECCDASAFRIAMIKTGADGSSAVLIAPDKKRYIVKIGTRVGNRDGKITKIDERGINVKQVIIDEDGKIISTEEVLIPMPVAKKTTL